MNIVGIVAEYNPFHNGHLYHLQHAKKVTNSSHSIVVMSPNFVQRGEAAICDKWTRTHMALSQGADLVIELPSPYASASAEFFAKASVSLLDHCQIVSHLNFASESNDIKGLTRLADILSKEPAEFKELLKKHLDSGISFPSARAKALSIYGPKAQELINDPNNILGIEYIKAIKRLSSPIIPTTIQRQGSQYHSKDITSHMASATAIREQILKGNWNNISRCLPSTSYNMLYNKSSQLVSYKDLSSFLSYRLLFSTPQDLANIVGIGEGMENRIFKAFSESNSIEDIVAISKSKRYTQTAIQRMLLNIILQLTKDDFNEFESKGGVQYIRILGFRKSSAHLLGALQDKASLPLVINLAKDYKNLPLTARKMLDFEIRASNIYSSLQGPYNNYNLDYTQPIIKI